MTKIGYSMISAWMLLIAGHVSFAQDARLQTYKWQTFQFTYPQHWAIVLDQDAGQARQVKLIADQDETYSVLMSLMNNFSEPDEEYLQNPVMASISFGLGSALRLAGSYGESAVALSIGSVASAYGPVPSARFLISAPDPQYNEFYMLECFHLLAAEKPLAYFVMVNSRGARGQVNDNPAYYEQAAEAYAIARSLVFE